MWKSRRKIFPMSLLLCLGGPGASAAYSYPFISAQQRATILTQFREITTSDKPCTSFPRKKLALALSGMYLNPQGEITTKTNAELCEEILRANKEKQEPIVREDSLTAWGNIAAERYGLSVADILALKEGETFEVILMDRNVGDYLEGSQIGSKFNPKTDGFSYARYTHKQGLVGRLDMYRVGVVHENFKWEINMAAYAPQSAWFWGPIPRGTKISALNPQLKVGWRGPTIRATDAAKMPTTFTHYSTWWDDYLPFRKRNFLK